MFNLIKSKENTYPEVVYDIHNEFNTASDKLLEVAKSIIKRVDLADLKKADRLSKVGFDKAKQAVEAKEIADKVATSKRHRDLILKYRVSYPNNKFILESQVEDICKKYNLVLGGVDRYTGFVPEKNLREIEGFKGVEKEDMLDDIVVFNETLNIIENINKDKILDHKEVEWLINNYIKTHEITYIGKRMDSYPEYTMLVNRNIKGVCSDVINEKLSLQICAPIKDMEMNGDTLVDGYKIQKHIPDPVVLQPIIGGYLIITAWGDESEDPIVVNENHN